jgi:thiamine monophosphate synthase
LLQALQLKPSYIALGHLFATPTKDMPSIPQGLRLVGWQQKLCQQQQIPAVAIGGVDASHLPTLRAMGLAGVAMVRAIVAPGEIRANCEHLLSLWQSPAPSPAQSPAPSYAPPHVPERNHGLN